MDDIELLVKRLDSLNIKVELTSNFPWVYLEKVNGKSVTEKYMSDYGFTLAFLPIRKDQKIKFTDFDVIFKVIRKYTS